MARQHGRYLSGFGSAEHPDDPRSSSVQSLRDMELLDDTYGSGIFDPAGRQGTSNAGTGIFESNYSLPGYVGRERPFAVSPEVRDLTDGADVVVIPSGGLNYVETGGRLTGPVLTAEGRPKPPAVEFQTTLTTGPTPRDQVYVHIAAGRETPIRGHAPRIEPVPGAPHGRIVPAPPERRLGQRADFEPRDARMAVTPAPRAQRATRGFGSFSTMPTWKLALAGFMIGASVGVGVHYYRKRRAA